ncbi:MAG: Xaa-Pro peptidase family protein [Chloroflexota bacterium]|nr:Xaa-Pro peptidase family protein [Chloroflexota bacterium]
MLTQDGCIARQQRWRETMNALELDVVALSDYRDIYYLTGALIPHHFAGTPVPLLLLLFANGNTILFMDSASHGGGFDVVVPTDGGYGVGEVLTYTWANGGTTNPDLTARLAACIEARLDGMAALQRLGYQGEYLPRSVAMVLEQTLHPGEWLTIDGELEMMQRRKYPDEIESIRASIRVGLAGYDAARAAIAPGVAEIEVLSAARTAALRAAGEIVYLHGDFASGAMGGFARQRPIEAGELYVVDLWVYHHGYWSDMCRTFSVGNEPTPFQRDLYDHIAAIHADIGTLIQPDMDGRDAFAAVDARIRQHPALRETGLTHHAGHALGLRAHEQPDLNPERGGALELGCVFTVEPGGYPDDARGGVRLENVYLVTETGIENLSPYPFGL